jgi:hypothetical protein
VLSRKHHVRALKCYDDAVHQLYRLSASKATDDCGLAQNNPIVVLLFSLFEWSTGSPQLFFEHITGADSILLVMHQLMVQTDLGGQSLSCWATMYPRKSLHKLPFRPLGIEIEREFSSRMSPTVRSLAHRYAKSPHDRSSQCYARFTVCTPGLC